LGVASNVRIWDSSVIPHISSLQLKAGRLYFNPESVARRRNSRVGTTPQMLNQLPTFVVVAGMAN
jgi:hypothetical protein